jgi:hypothetical protein
MESEEIVALFQEGCEMPVQNCLLVNGVIT